MNPVARSLLGCVLASALCSGCALTSKADLVGTRYFTPEVPRAHLNKGEPSGRQARAGLPEVRLGRISSGSHVRERIAYRDAAHELGYYEDQRWAERPEVYVRRQLTRTLFEEGPFRRVVGGTAPVLEVEVVAFDELRLPTGGAARVELKVVLLQNRDVILEETITIDRAVATTAGKPAIEDVVAAMAQALDAATEQVATRVAAALPARTDR